MQQITIAEFLIAEVWTSLDRLADDLQREADEANSTFDYGWYDHHRDQAEISKEQIKADWGVAA